MDAECVDRYSQLARNFAVDALTAEVAGVFGCEGIETLVLKVPVLAKWLYPGEVRPYVDCDLMVAPEDRARAAQHANLGDSKPLEDLRRALARVEESKWSSALELARAYRGVPGFAAGLRLLPEGGDLARRLDLGEVRSLQYALRREDVIAEQLDVLLSADAGIRWKLAIATSRILFHGPTTCGGGHRWPGAASSGWLEPTSGARSG